jgi:hypothetical protein
LAINWSWRMSMPRGVRVLPDENWMSQRARIFRQGIENRHRARQPRARACGGRPGIVGEVIGGENANGFGRGDLPAQLLDVSAAGAQPDGNRDGDGHDAGILGAEERDAEARPGVGDQHQPFAACDAAA